jgi:integrase
LRKAFRDAVAVDQVLASNPAERAKRPRGGRRELAKWAPDQLRIFLQTARGHRLSAFYQLATCTGARRGELLYLRWNHIDLDAAEIRLLETARLPPGPESPASLEQAG